MGFQTGLSGLNASSRSLDVIGNNIANANTSGMKASRVEFESLVAASSTAGNGTAAGIGVGIAAVTQKFGQGNINVSGRDLDLAINGGGFFQLTNTDGTTVYTRDGSFKLDKVGNLVTNSGAHVMGYPTNLAGVATSTTVEALKLPTSAPIAAKQTGAIIAEFNLDARAPIASSQVPPTPISTYGTSVTAYDSQGVPVPLSLYFSKITPTTPGTDEWAVFDDPNALATASLGSLVFDALGKLDPASTTFTGLTLTPPAPSVVPAFPVTIDVSDVTQYGAGFSVSALSQDGYPPGEFVGLKINATGVISARYSNGEIQAAGQVALADFRNVQGLNPTGGGSWSESNASGPPVQGAAGVGKFGAINAGALEDSNVDVTEELINMMTAQRSYQANAQSIKTQDQVLSTLVNLR
ncbi:MAG: flagellar hook protein FlgE [Rhodoferax sp.]|nr:flagellar hook protein FlgE [Rhodoferax sp.]